MNTCMDWFQIGGVMDVTYVEYEKEYGFLADHKRVESTTTKYTH